MSEEGIHIETALEASLPPVSGDPTALEEVIINLLLNAMQAIRGSGSIRVQTAGNVTSLYRQILRSRETALLYRNTLIPLAHQAFEVMLIAYQSGKVDFITLISAFRQESDSRAAYLQAVNALLAGKVAIEQAAGGALQ